MTKRISQRSEDLRRMLAEEAARWIGDHGVEDYGVAKRKAAERLGIADAAALPSNLEIEAALRERQRLFGGTAHGARLKEQRRAAIDAMRLLGEFEPRLVGPVLAGTATAHSDISLHVFADFAEAVAMRLMEVGIPHSIREHRLKMDADRSVSFPALRFQAGERTIDATVFPVDGIRQAPYSPVDGRPMRRADLREVLALVDSPT